MKNKREQDILDWLAAVFNNRKVLSLQQISGDASLRQYYRCTIGDNSHIVMDSKNDPSLPMFIKLARQFLEWGLFVPNIYESDLKKGLALISDLGDDLYLDKLNDKTANQLYLAAIQELLIMQRKFASSELLLPTIGIEYIQNKLNVFQQWFLQKHLHLELTEEQQQLLGNLEKIFISVFYKQPQIIVHLDYHSRNLVLLPKGKTGILDFQDAMVGPITYDLVSLFQDAYISWPRERVIEWLIKYQEKAFLDGLIKNKDRKQFIKYFDIVGLQRHLKNLGVFSRLYYRDLKDEYLNNIPALLKYVLTTCEQYKELQEVSTFFTKTIVPKLSNMHGVPV